MRAMHRHRLLVVLFAGAALLGAVLPALSYADAVATTEPATSVSYTTAVLNGVANPTNPDSEYAFQYGTSATSFGGITQPTAIGSGSRNVSATVTKLSPGATYYFRLIVVEGSYPSATAHDGATLSFKTPAVAPGTVATTGSATDVTTGSATLNGVVNVSDPGSAWAFQYGTSTKYGNATPVQHVGSGLTVVSAAISGLKPGIRYRYRLVVVQGSSPASASVGRSRRLTTWGMLFVRSHTVRVGGGRAAIRVKCSGGAHGVCKGRLSLTTSGVHSTIVPCAGAGFAIHGGKRRVLRPRVRAGCLALLAKAGAHGLSATLHAGFAARQTAFTRAVTLAS